jgi:hypothetical protein
MTGKVQAAIVEQFGKPLVLRPHRAAVAVVDQSDLRALEARRCTVPRSH